MENNKKTAPEIRFPGFTDPWEQRKFGDVTEIRSASRVHREEWTSSGVPFYRSSDVMAALNGTENEKAFISIELYEKLSAVSGKLAKGDVLVTGGGSVGNPYIVPNDEPLYTKDADLLWIKNNGSMDPMFVYEFFLSPVFRAYLGSVSHVGTIAHYTITQLSDTPISLPSIEEQRKIGETFKLIDNAITLHQCMHYPHQICRRRYESISFYRHNTTAWEQRKLGDVFEEYSEKNHEELPPLTIIQGKGTILREESDRNLQYDKNSLSGYKLVHKDDFIVHLRSFEGGLEKANSDGIVSPAYHMFHGNSTDSRFYYPFFRSRQFISVLLKPHIYGIRDGKSIDIAGMKTIMIPVPSYEEQVKIGDLIESLDTAITLHQRNNSQ